MIRLRHLPRRSSKNCDLQFANVDRLKANYSVDEHASLSSLICSGCVLRVVVTRWANKTTSNVTFSFTRF